MQKLALLHDGSIQGWQATYLAFHVGVRLGASLHALLIDSDGNDALQLEQRVVQVETGARAAGLAIETRLLVDYSMGSIKESTSIIDGLFVPRHLAPDEKSAVQLLDAFACPLWVTSRAPEIHEMAVLVDNLIKNERMISYTNTLAHRFQQSLTGLIAESELDMAAKSETLNLTWMSLPAFSFADVAAALGGLNTDLLFISSSNAFMVDILPCNFVIFPEIQDA